MLSVMCNGEYMEYLKLNNIIRVLSVGFLIALINKFGFASSMGTVFILAPYLLLFLLANQAAYKTKFRIFFRSLSGALVGLFDCYRNIVCGPK
jgi:hypothetical protein